MKFIKNDIFLSISDILQVNVIRISNILKKISYSTNMISYMLAQISIELF